MPPRVANTTLRLPATPPTFGFITTNAFPGLIFNYPVAIDAPPGETNRLFVVEKTGRIMVITNLANPTVSVFLNLTNRAYFIDEGGVMGIAFHPGFSSNRFFYVNYTLVTNTAAGYGNHDRIARFEASPSNSNQAFVESEVPLITQFRRANEHHGGDIHFGPDGYLYVSLGDESGSDDTFNNGQVIDKNFFSGVLRIDVDKRPENLPPNPHPAVTDNYAIPRDNPFVGATEFNSLPVDPAKIHTEFWATGLRNPWRMSFDPATGFLFCGDVGQATYEEINLIVRGGNYGWPIREGTIAGPQLGSPRGGSRFSSLDPLLEYQHGSGDALQAAAVMGGLVYHGNRFSQITGNYIYADHVNGNIWAAKLNGAKLANPLHIATAPGISAFGIDPSNGDVLMARYYLKTLDRLIYTATPHGTAFPATLADTGAFADLRALEPNSGIVPYNVVAPLWSDGALKRRWFSIPNTNAFLRTASDGTWQFPVGTVWIKHFELPLTNGAAESVRRLETRFLVRYSSGFYGITYRWDSATNATLVPEQGMDESILVSDGGLVRTQLWHYPSRSECLLCHNPQAGAVLGFKSSQLNCDFDYGAGGVTNQIGSLLKAGYFNTNSLPRWMSSPALAPLTNTAVSLEYRVRSYLDANCSQCHQPDGPGWGNFDVRAATPSSSAGIIDGILFNDEGSTDNRAISPGSLPHSVMLERISTRGARQMPPLATDLTDAQAVAVMSDWITNGLAAYQSFPDWQAAHFDSATDPEAAAGADPDNDGASNWLEYLTHTDPNNPADVWRISARWTGAAVEISFPQIANRGFVVEWTGSLGPSSVWQPLEVPGNRPFFSATNLTATVFDTTVGSAPRYYRVEVLEP